MNIKDLEWKLGLFADAAVFDVESKEALRHARDIVAALRAARDLPKDFNAKDLVGEVWAAQIDERKAHADRYHWLRGRMSPKDIAIFSQRPAGYDDDAPEYVDSAIDKELGAGSITANADGKYSGPVEVFAGYMRSEGGKVDIGFELPIGASQVEKDAAFFAALSELVDVEYLTIGTNDKPLA